jgi:hypothetical protein
MFAQQLSKIGLPVIAALIGGAVASATPASAQLGRPHDCGERPLVRHVVVERRIVRRPIVDQTVVVRRPRVVHRVVHYPRYAYPVRYGWRPWHPRRPWHDRPTCRLPERYLCR